MSRPSTGIPFETLFDREILILNGHFPRGSILGKFAAQSSEARYAVYLGVMDRVKYQLGENPTVSGIEEVVRAIIKVVKENDINDLLLQLVAQTLMTRGADCYISGSGHLLLDVAFLQSKSDSKEFNRLIRLYKAMGRPLPKPDLVLPLQD